METFKSLQDFEKYALDETLDEYSKQYFSAEAGVCSNRGNNEAAFKRYLIRPRMLRDVSGVDMRCTILGIPVSSPIGVAPTALHCLAHEDAELATALACCKENCIFTLSCVSSRLLEDVSNYVCQNYQPKTQHLWMQVYMQFERSVIKDLIRRAESSGFTAIVVTVDAPNGGKWRRQLSDSFFEYSKSRIVNIPSLPRQLFDSSVTFEDLKWLKGITPLPLVVKGILDKEDAVEAIRCGVSAIYVSNHGSRLIERVISTIDVLEEITNAVKNINDSVEVYVDGGVRIGSDVLTCLAMGAKAVFIGRPAIWGLSVNGNEGVQRVLQILKEDLRETMQLTGVSRFEDIKKSMIVQMPY